ncbi:hypothetical protein RJ640_000042 [Escallonia rubra]|uniref:Uncharacterized protein n=1 Tax=Escallonia rubra TaxID=112253 RepID=A0AA88R235_9ASTE|nr:hypothetical protein RJ640_000042 [Escallonia rubra]
MESDFCIVDNLCATTTQVLPTIIFSKASWTRLSDMLSRALVASSRRRIAGFLSIALASAILCFWPPESWTPLSPQTALEMNLFGNGFIPYEFMSISKRSGLPYFGFCCVLFAVYDVLPNTSSKKSWFLTH